jgi:hypothetical protein
MQKSSPITIGNLSANLKAGATLTAVPSVGNLNGRVTTGPAYTDAGHWCHKGGLPPAEYERRFRAALGDVRRATGTKRCFRGIEHSVCPADCGPRKTPPSVGDRYNVAGEIVFYLSDSADGVAAELRERKGPKWIQEFDVLLDTLNIAECVKLDDQHFVNAAFFYAERVKRFEPATTYDFSQRVAQLVRERGFDGMVVRGALGEYQNVIIFEPAARWKPWVVTAPRPL